MSEKTNIVLKNSFKAPIVVLTALLALFFLSLTSAYAQQAVDPYYDELDVYNEIDYNNIRSNDGQFDYWDQRPISPTYIAPARIAPVQPAPSQPVAAPKSSQAATNTTAPQISDDFYDDLDVYESDAYSIESQQQIPDNDIYYYIKPGTVFTPLPPKTTPQNNELNVYENPNYRNGNKEQYVPYNPYTANQQQYQPLPYNANDEQSRTLYQPIHPEQYNDYNPDRDFWPDYYDY